MHKKIIILFLALLCLTNTYAQRSIYEDVDTTEKTLDEVIIDSDVDTDVDTTITTSTVTYENNDIETPNSIGDNIKGDTTIFFRNVFISPDTITAWKNSKKYEWIKSIDNFLKDKVDKDKKDTEENMKRIGKASKGFSAMDNFLNAGIFKMLLWIIAACVLGFIIYNLFLSKGVFGRASKKITKEIEEVIDEDSLDNDFDSLYKKAYAAGDNTLAMRYLFLKTLQKLNDKELIHFAPDKTNSMYVRELPQTKRNDFAQLALYYEYIWYGKTAVQQQVFDGIVKKYNEFLNKI
jgi:hypothetical protein